MTDRALFDALDTCLAGLASGESFEDCLRRYPGLAGELRPMLEAAQLAAASGHASPHAQMRSRARFLGAAAGLRPQPARAGRFAGLLGRALSTFIALAAGFILGTAGLYYASASTLPGDSLYGLKRAFEDTRLQFASDPSTRYALEEGFNNRRSAELTAVLAEDRAVVVSFGGLLLTRTETQWQVGGFNLEITDQTRIVGDPQPGFYVSAMAENRDGTLVAIELRAEEFEVIGVLAQSGGRWSIDGTTFSIGPETLITGTVRSGVTAAARIRVLQTGDRVAVSLITQAGDPVPPQPAASRTPSASPSPRPTRTQTPRPTVAPTRPLPTPTIAAPQSTVVNNGNSNEDGNDNSGSGNSNSDDDGDNSGPGGGGDDDDDHSGPGGGGGDDDHSGSGSGGRGGDDSGGGGNSGSGGGDD